MAPSSCSSRGAYEAGIDELIVKILETVGGDAALRRAEVESDSPAGMIRSAIMRVSRLARLAWRIFVDADLNGRFAVEMFVFVFMFILGLHCFACTSCLLRWFCCPSDGAPVRRGGYG